MRLQKYAFAGKFSLTAISVFALILVAPMVASFNTIYYGTMITLGAVGLFPFVIYASVFAIAMFRIVLAELLMFPIGQGSYEGFWRLYEDAADSIVPYYQWLFERPKWLLFGAFFGATSALIALWLVVLLLKEPGEKRTTELLANLKEAVISHFEKSRKLPPRTDGQLLYRDLGMDQDGFVLDGFGRPLDYDVRETSFRFRSMGYDGRLGTDDLCIAGSVKKTVTTVLKKHEAGILKAVKDSLKNPGIRFRIQDATNTLEVESRLPGMPEFNELVCPQN
ncbi:MAG: hypothetical protein V4719_25785 [Planctomycetota bacterium]